MSYNRVIIVIIVVMLPFYAQARRLSLRALKSTKWYSRTDSGTIHLYSNAHLMYENDTGHCDNYHWRFDYGILQRLEDAYTCNEPPYSKIKGKRGYKYNLINIGDAQFLLFTKDDLFFWCKVKDFIYLESTMSPEDWSGYSFTLVLPDQKPPWQ